MNGKNLRIVHIKLSMKLAIVVTVVIFLVDLMGLSVQRARTHQFGSHCKRVVRVWEAPIWITELTLLFHTCKEFKIDPAKVHLPNLL